MTHGALRPTYESVIPIDRRLHSKNHSARRCVPWGGGLHYDASVGSDESAVGWFLDPACDVSYDLFVLDNGDVVAIHDEIEHEAGWHFGVATPRPEWPTRHLTKDGHGRPLAQPFAYGAANDALIGLSVSTGGTSAARPLAAQVTMAQGNTIIVVWALTVAYGQRWWDWPADAATSRLIGHEDEAIYNPKNEPDSPALWGKRGRKSDPSGGRLALEAGRPILSTDGVRQAAHSVLADARLRAAFCEWATVDVAFVDDALDRIARGG